MAARHASIGENGMKDFKNRYEIASPYCFHDTPIDAMIKSCPTNYLSSSAKALDGEMKTREEFRSPTIEMQPNVAAMRSIDDICEVLASLPTDARMESASQEVETKYDAIQGALRNANLRTSKPVRIAFRRAIRVAKNVRFVNSGMRFPTFGKSDIHSGGWFADAYPI